jgi:hypothetical protein
MNIEFTKIGGCSRKVVVAAAAVTLTLSGLAVADDVQTEQEGQPVQIVGALKEDKAVTGGPVIEIPEEIECPEGTDYDCVELPALENGTCSTNFTVPRGVVLAAVSVNQAFCEKCECVRGGRGCFAPGTKIMLGDKSHKPIEEIAAGDLLWNPLLKKAVRVNRVIEGPEALPYVKIVAGSALLKLSQGHAVHTKNGIKKAIDIKKGDLLFDGSGNAIEVKEAGLVHPVEPRQRVLNVVLDGDDSPEQHALLSDGIVTGDLVLQQKIGKSK